MPVSADDLLILQFTRLARLAEMPRYPNGPEEDFRLGLKRVERQGLGYNERVLQRIIRWVAEAKSLADIEAEVMVLVETERYAPEPARSGTKTSGGKISAADRAANTARLLATMQEQKP